MVPMAEVGFLPSLDRTALVCALHHGMGRFPTDEETDHVEKPIKRALSWNRYFVGVEFGELRPYWQEGVLTFCDGSREFWGGTHNVSVSAEIARHHKELAESICASPMPDLYEGLNDASEYDIDFFGHLPRELLPNEVIRLEAAYRDAVPTPTQDDLAEYIALAAKARRTSYDYSKVWRGQAVIRLSSNNEMEFIDIQDVSVFVREAYANDRESHGLPRCDNELPMSKQELDRLQQALSGITDATCSGYLPETIAYLESQGLPAGLIFQYFMRNGMYCDCMLRHALESGAVHRVLGRWLL